MDKTCFSVAAMFSDHMVLQREKEIVIWGNGPEDKCVCVTLGEQTVETKVTGNQWRVTLSPLSAGGPYIMKCVCANECITFSDFMFVEFCLSFLQSNI